MRRLNILGEGDDRYAGISYPRWYFISCTYAECIVSSMASLCVHDGNL